MRRILAITLLLTLISTLAILEVTYAQPIGVVKFEIDRKTVYTKYQYIEVKAYLYGAPTITRAEASLIAGITVVTNLTLTVLMEPIEVDGVLVSRVLIGRVFVPEAAYVGPALLRVIVEGTFAGTPFSNSTVFTITVLSSRFVEEERFSAQRAYDRALLLIQLGTIYGIDVTKAMETLNHIESVLSEADTLLLLGDVESASNLYTYAKTKAEELVSSLLVEIVTVHRSILSSLDELTRRTSTLEEATTKLANETSMAITGLSSEMSRLAEYQVNISRRLDGMVIYVNELVTTLANYTTKTSSAIEELTKSAISLSKQQENITTNLNALRTSIEELNSKVDSTSQSQSDMTTLVNNLQISIIILAIMVLIATITIAAKR
jgi:methyl-accepting chemotaxis protein